MRTVVFFAYRPVILFPDSIDYLATARAIADWNLTPSGYRPFGYSALLAALVPTGGSIFWVTALIQHLFGLAIAVLLYALLIRLRVRPVLAAIATLPVLLDESQLLIEQYMLSDPLSELLSVTAIVLLAWPTRRRPAALLGALVAGLLIGLGVITRYDGAALIAPAALFLLLRGGRWSSRALTTVALLVGFAAPVVGYAANFHHYTGKYAITGGSGQFLYGRVSGFADCTGLALPPYERTLCPTQSPAERPNTDFYTWNPQSPFYHLTPPTGMTPGAVGKDFALRIIEHQPGAYLSSVGDEIAAGFAPTRSGGSWSLASGYQQYSTNRVPGAASYGEVPLQVSAPLARFLTGYGKVVALPGPLLALALALGVVGGLLGFVGRHRLRWVTLFVTAAGVALVLPSDLLSIFSVRYQLPAIVMLPIGGALGLTIIADQVIRRRSPRASGDRG